MNTPFKTPSVNTTSALCPAIVTPSPAALDKRVYKKKKVEVKRGCKKRIESDQQTLTQIWPTSSPTQTCSSTTTQSSTRTVPIMEQASACFNNHKYEYLAEGDPLDLVKIYDVVQHNTVIQNELRDLDRLCALREEPLFFLVKK